jgi:Na+/melibiose symporter-like transporter
LLLLSYQVVLGFGIGMVMPSSLVCVQNAADLRDIGAATGCILFLRSMGGAFGSTLVGALLASGFAARLAEIGITAHIDLGDVRQSHGALAGVAPAMLPHVQAALAGAFHLAFLACAVAMLAAVIVALGMRDLPLRTSSANEPPEPAALAH